MEDDGQSGFPVGCGDSLVTVERPVAPTSDELTATVETLLRFDQDVDGMTDYYNALDQSTLRLDSATIINDRAVVKISGTMQLGGTCDDPRFVGQLQQTILNVPGVVSADITINGIPLDEVISERG